MVDVETVVQLALAQQGDRYVANAGPSANEADPSAFDCSGLVQWACGRAGVQPAMPDGSWLQQRWCKSNGTILTVEQAIATRGALLFKHRDADGNPVDPGPACPPKAHVAISLGDGHTIEAMGSQYGVLIASALNRDWTAGALIPGCTYASAPSPAPAPQPGPVPRPDKPYLTRGAQGPGVIEMQQLLIKLGIGRLAQYGATGNFLDVTLEAVRLFQDQVRTQHDASMVVDGECGPITWGWLIYLAG